MCRCQVIALVLALAATPALGDVLFLKGGGRITGEIVSETEAAVTVDIGAGKMTVPKSSVVRVESTISPLQKYRAQAASLAPGDVEGWRKLGRWAAAQGLSLQAREAFTRVKPPCPTTRRRIKRSVWFCSTATGSPRRRASSPTVSCSSRANG
jgi:hypothetical protein